MRKIAIIAVAIMLMSMTAYAANPWSDQDEEAQTVGDFVKGIMSDFFEPTMLIEYPGAEFEYGGRSMPGGEATATFLAYIETKQPGKDAVYHYIEVQLDMVNGNDALMEKYSL